MYVSQVCFSSFPKSINTARWICERCHLTYHHKRYTQLNFSKNYKTNRNVVPAALWSKHLEISKTVRVVKKYKKHSATILLSSLIAAFKAFGCLLSSLINDLLLVFFFSNWCLGSLCF